MAAAAPQWRQMLERSVKRNRSLAYSRYVQLATVRDDGRPANRTVVFRGFLDGADDLTFVTDRRSDKVGQAAANPVAEVAWYLPITREQYRVSGTLDVVTEAREGALAAARRKAWANMSDAGRQQFLWPHPGLPRIPDNEAAFTQPGPGPATDPSPEFCLVVLRVDEVDYINLRQNRRMVFKRSGGGGDAAEATGSGAGAGAGGSDKEGDAAAAAAADEEGEVPRDPPRSGAGWTALEVNP